MCEILACETCGKTYRPCDAGFMDYFTCCQEKENWVEAVADSFNANKDKKIEVI